MKLCEHIILKPCETVWTPNPKTVWTPNPETVWRHNPDTVWTCNPETVRTHYPETVWRHNSETVWTRNPETVWTHNPETVWTQNHRCAFQARKEQGRLSASRFQSFSSDCIWQTGGCFFSVGVWGSGSVLDNVNVQVTHRGHSTLDIVEFCKGDR